MYVLIVRHGESDGNANSWCFWTKPDHLHELTPRGWDQVLAAGKIILEFVEKGQELTGGARIVFWHSPFERVRQSVQGLFNLVKKDVVTVREKDVLSEMDFGKATGLKEWQMALRLPLYFLQRFLHKLNKTKFFLGPPEGDSFANVSYRLDQLVDSIRRMNETGRYTHLVMVTHGGTGRVLAHKLLSLTYDQIERELNFGNGDVRLIQLGPSGEGRDYGFIGKDGVFHEPKLVPHETAGDRLSRGAYVPSFAREVAAEPS